ncbi:8891_t:CDS:2, partial [Scutellospora calospora]
FLYSESYASGITMLHLDLTGNAAVTSDIISHDVEESIRGVQEILNNRTEQLKLKDSKFRYYFPANQEAITEVFESIFSIDPTLKIKETIQVQIRNHLALVEFIDTHCQMRAYSFQACKQLLLECFKIKKCNSSSCLYCKPIRLLLHKFGNLSFLADPVPSKDNMDHYATFQDIYGTKTTEEHRPTYMQSQAKSELIPKSILIAEKIRDYIDCKDCWKHRCVYSNKSLTDDELYDFQQTLELYSYSCGAPIFPDDHYLKDVIFVRTQISCDSPIEILYYSSHKVGNYQICYYCRNSDNLVSLSKSLKERFKQIYLLCEICQENRRSFYTRAEIKTNNRDAK